MAETQTNQITSRIDKLERQNRWMRNCLMFTFVIGSGVVLVAAGAPDDDVLQAKQIVIRDDHGNKRIVLGSESFDSITPRTGVFVYSPDGKDSVGLTASDNSAQLIVDEDGQHRLSLGSGKEKYAGLLVYAEPEKKAGQILLFYTDDGKPMFGMNDSNGKTRIVMLLDNKRSEKPLMALQDGNQDSFFSQVQP